MSLIAKKFTLSTFQKHGKAAGEDEADFIPDFYKFFFDEENHAETVTEPGVFFILGRKGTGKSLLARYVAHKATISEHNYIKKYEVQSFRNFKFQKLAPHKQEDFHSREYFTFWVTALWLAVVNQRIDDETLPETDDSKSFRSFLRGKLKKGISATEVIEKTSSLKLSGGLKDLFNIEHSTGYKEKPRDDNDDHSFIESNVISALRGGSLNSILFFDDLDDGFEDTELYEQSLSSLIYAVDHINRQLHRNEIPAKVVLLLRTDIFRTINTSDLNKFKIDNSVVLDWSIEDKENSSLIRLLVHRLLTSLNIRMASNKYAEAFYELFDESIESKKTAAWLQDLTIARPRDLVQLTTLACRACPSHSKFSAYSLLQARPRFSQFLYDDLRNEMKGHKDRVFIENALNLLKGVPTKGTFTLEKLREKKPDLFATSTSEGLVREYLSLLFNFSAIGNTYFDGDNKAKVNYQAWSHREDQVRPDFEAAFSVHLGLRFALKAGMSE